MTDLAELAEWFARSDQVSMGVETNGQYNVVTLSETDKLKVARACRAAATKHRAKITLPAMPWDKP
jgi:hypothetical protein